jgi:hypothetical protein
MTTDLEAALVAATKALTDRFDGIIDPDTVGRYVRDSYVALHRTAFANPELPDLAQRHEAAPVVPGPRYELWELAHPPGSDLDGVRMVRDDINRRVQDLLTDLTTKR